MADSAHAETIGLLGGTFDPVHKGHRAIIQSFLESGYIDRLIVILTPVPPHKTEEGITDFGHRLNMLRLAMKGVPRVEISTIEKKLPEPSYTINTINYYLRNHPDARLFLCLGEDSLKKFKSWYHWQEILEKCSLLVARRPDSDTSDIPSELEPHTFFIPHEPVDISSTQIRAMLKAGKAADTMLADEVIAYIQNHNLYTD